MGNLLKLFIAFIKVGTFGFGGGNAMLPLIETEVVDNYGFITVEEFSSYYAFGSTLPGPITTKLAAVIGYDVGGVIGSIVALSALVLPSVVGMLLLFSIYTRYENEAWMGNLLKGVKPIVIALLIKVVWGLNKGAFVINGKVNPISIAFCLVGLAVIFTTKLHPAFLIFGSMALGVFVF